MMFIGILPCQKSLDYRFLQTLPWVGGSNRGTLRVDGFVTLEPQALVAAARVFLSKHRVKEPSLNVSIDRGIRLDLDSDSESEDGPGAVPVKFHGTNDIFTVYMYHENQENVGKYTSPMDSMREGVSNSTPSFLRDGRCFFYPGRCSRVEFIPMFFWDATLDTFSIQRFVCQKFRIHESEYTWSDLLSLGFPKGSL